MNTQLEQASLASASKYSDKLNEISISALKNAFIDGVSFGIELAKQEIEKHISKDEQEHEIKKET